MPGYVDKALQLLKRIMPSRPQHQQHQHTIPYYGTKIQYANPEDSSRSHTKEVTAFVQRVIGTFLFYGGAVNVKMLTALCVIASTYVPPIEEKLRITYQFLYYSATHPDSILTYTVSNKLLKVHSDVSYLSKPNTKSHIWGVSYYQDTPLIP